MTASSELRALTVADVAAGVALSSEAGWNQNAADWRFLIENGEGIGLDADGRLVGTAIVLPFPPDIAWIGMVLVTASHRSRGLATRMVDWALRHAQARGLVPALDATPAGREVYRRMGFADGLAIARLRAPERDAVSSGRMPEKLDVEEIAALDRSAFGVDRSVVLRHLAERAPELAVCMRRGGRVIGYALGRDGRVAHEVGPIVAEDEATALALLDAARARIDGPLILDAFLGRRAFRDGLAARGWTEQRPFTRMALGTLPIGRPELIFAAAGPELA